MDSFRIFIPTYDAVGVYEAVEAYDDVTALIAQLDVATYDAVAIVVGLFCMLV